MPSGRCAYAAVVGHQSDKSYIKIDYDLRAKMGVELDDVTDIEVTRCGIFGTLRWYLTVADPLVRIPASLAILSLGLAVISLFIAIIPLFFWQ